MVCELCERDLFVLFCFNVYGRIFSFENSLLMHQDSCLGYTSFSGNCLCNVYNPPTSHPIYSHHLSSHFPNTMLKCPSSALFCLLFHSLTVLMSEMLKPLLNNWHLYVKDLWLKDAFCTLYPAASLSFLIISLGVWDIIYHSSFIIFNSSTFRALQQTDQTYGVC